MYVLLPMVCQSRQGEHVGQVCGEMVLTFDAYIVQHSYGGRRCKGKAFLGAGQAGKTLGSGRSITR